MPASITSLRSHLAAKRGSGLVVAIIFCALLVLIVASVLQYAGTETRMLHRHELYLRARNAAESMSEYGFYQVRKLAEASNDFNISSDIFRPGKANAPSLPDLSYFAGSKVITSGYYAPQLVAGYVTDKVTGSAGLYYVDPNQTDNSSDPLKGMWIIRRDVALYAKASVSSNDGGPPLSCFVTETISIRASPLFAHAIFYNMDMEIFPGSLMRIYGPVHANGNLFLSSQSNSLNFYSVLSCSGNFYHAWKSNQTGAMGTGSETLGKNPINIVDGSGTLVNVNTSYWRDSTLGDSTSIASQTNTMASYLAALATSAATHGSDFRKLSTTVWQGNLQTSTHGIAVYKPVAIGQYVEDTSYSSSTDSSINSERLLIEPPTTSSSANYNADVEYQKFASNAGIYIRITPSTGAITVTSRSKTDPSKTKALTLPSSNTLVKWNPYVTTATTTATKKTTTSAKSGSTTVYTTTTTTTTTTTASSTSSSSSSSSTSTASSTSSSGTVGTTSSSSTATSYSGLYDQRRKAGIDLVEFDMNALRSIVTEMQKSSSNRSATLALGNFDDSDWTGIVYIEIVGGATTTLAGATVAASSDAVNSGVRIINGTGTVPSYAKYTGQESGLTIATNTALYVLGHYNADGVIDDTTSPQTPESGEVPAALVGDTVTILSSDWQDSLSRTQTKQSSTANTEIAAAILGGIVPTNKSGNNVSSGGAHNFVRFLQNHSDKVVIRGSLVCLFEARMNPGNWLSSVYNPPSRLWGFSELFQNGTYPPGTPKVISYRRLNFAVMNESDWTTAVLNLTK